MKTFIFIALTLPFFWVLPFTGYSQQARSSYMPFNKLLPYHTSRVGTDFAYDSCHNCFYYACGMGVEIQPGVFPQGVMFVKADMYGNTIDSIIGFSFYGTIYNIHSGSILITSDSCLFLSTIWNDSLFLTKTTLNFDTLWQKKHYGHVNSALLTENNSIVYVGCVGDSGSQGLIFKLDSNGNELWHQFVGIASDNNIFTSVTQAYDGSYIAGGVSYKYTYGDLYMARVDSNGNFKWDWRFIHPNRWEYELGIVGIIPQKDSTFVAIGSYGNNIDDNVFYGLRFIKFKINKQPVLDSVYQLDRVYDNHYYYYDYQNGIPGLQPDTGLYSNLPLYATGLKDGSIIVSVWTGMIPDEPSYLINKIYKISPSGKIIWGRQLRAIPFSFGPYEVIYDIIPMPDGGFTTYGFIYGNSSYIYPWGQSLWLVHTDSLGCDGFGSCDTNITVTFSPPLPDTLCVTDTFHTIAKLAGTNYPGQFNVVIRQLPINYFSHPADSLIFHNIDTTSDIPITLIYPGYSDMIIEYSLIASDTTFYSNLLNAKDTTLLSGFTASHMPVYSPFPSHLIHFVSCPDTNNAINTLTTDYDLFIYPNPANDNLTISITNYELRMTSVSVFDVMGKQVLQATPQYHSRENGNPRPSGKTMDTRLRGYVKIGVGNLPAGVYFVKVATNKGTIVKKLIINN